MRTFIIGIASLVIGGLVGIYVLAPRLDRGAEVASVAPPPAGAPVAEEPGGGSELGPPVRLRMVSAFASSMVQLGTLGVRIAERLDAASNGNIQLKFFEPGALVPAFEIFDAVSSGAVDVGWSGSGYWAGKVPALQFFTTVPFGPAPGEYLAWLEYGGGTRLFEEVYAPHNIHPLHCGMIAAEGSGWFRTPIESLDDLKGLKMRFFGLGAKVMEKLGVTTQLIAGGDIFPALELGTIDATEYSMPAIDLDLGFYQVAKHYYFPGWHQPSSLLEFIVNQERWDALDEARRAMIETACGDSIREGIAEGEAIQFGALQELQAKGVTLHRWTPEILDAMRAGWEEVLAEESAKDEDFARVWESLRDFREGYALWASYGYLD
jgi:TRAP-type mannitol/chloroaromatic compound transport system substrate-binding protein